MVYVMESNDVLKCGFVNVKHYMYVKTWSLMGLF